ncbi:MULTISPECIES: hypothetical protein [unclassified Clostridium]|uniref:hypothetical protein n=1 Tax=unclassified Clostridium TaxID=2614128 RepID=UPI0025BD1E87|nr:MULTISPECIES: hypothetical protein [unclassified Clostridium]
MAGWNKARYIMEYVEKGKRKQHIIYANTLKEAKIKAKAIAEKDDIGITYGLELEQMKA